MRILLADPTPDVRAALRLVLEQQGDLVITVEARDAVNLLAQIARCCPDVVLLDTDLPGLLPFRQSSNASLADLVETLELHPLTDPHGTDRPCIIRQKRP